MPINTAITRGSRRQRLQIPRSSGLIARAAPPEAIPLHSDPGVVTPERRTACEEGEIVPFIRHAALGGTALLALLISSLIGNPAVAAEPDVSTAQVIPGTLVIRTAKDPNLVLDMAYGSSVPGTPVTLYPLHGGPNQ